MAFLGVDWEKERAKKEQRAKLDAMKLYEGVQNTRAIENPESYSQNMANQQSAFRNVDRSLYDPAGTGISGETIPGLSGSVPLRRPNDYNYDNTVESGPSTGMSTELGGTPSSGDRVNYDPNAFGSSPGTTPMSTRTEMAGEIQNLDAEENVKKIYVPSAFRYNREVFDPNAKGLDVTGRQLAGLYSDIGKIGSNIPTEASQLQIGGAKSLAQLAAERAQPSQASMSQADLLNMLMQSSRGQGPSVAQAQLQQGTDQAIATARAMSAGQRGMTQGMASQIGAQTAGTLGQQAANQAAQLRAQEMMASQQLAGQMAQGIRGAEQSERLSKVNEYLAASQAAGDTRTADDRARALAAQTALQAAQGQTGIFGAETGMRQSEEEFRYNQYRDWENLIASQFGAQPTYTVPWQTRAGLGMIQGGAEAVGNIFNLFK